MGPLLLPHGLFDADGDCHREVWLRPLVGADELRLLEDGGEGVDADRLLCSGVERLGGYAELDADAVGALTRGDRQFLLLRLWAMEHGDRGTLVVRCPNPACRERADLPVSFPEIAPEGEGEPRLTFEVRTAIGSYTLREPTGAIDASLAALGGGRAKRAAGLWAWMIVGTPDGAPFTAASWGGLAPHVRGELALGFAHRARIPDLLFLSRCPSCGAMVELGLDPLQLFRRRRGVNGDRLLAEVHCLAWYYHWPQAEILGLTRRERWRYLELIRRQVEGRPLLDREG